MTRPRLTLVALSLLGLVGALLIVYRLAEAPQSPLESMHSESSGTILIPPEQLGAYGSYGPAGTPAWELSRDAELVQLYGGDAVLLLRCDCGKVIRMLDHQVSADGAVSPSIWHDTPDCGWHVWGRLEGWDHGAWSVQTE